MNASFNKCETAQNPKAPVGYGETIWDVISTRPTKLFGPVAQLVRALVLWAESRGFELRRGKQTISPYVISF